MTQKQYLAEPTKTTWTARVLNITHGETTIVRLDRTIFHAQGGGQKADRGRIGPAVVIHVAHNADNVDHHVENAAGLEVGAEVVLEVDQAWRRLNAAYHTAGHLLASVVEAMYPGMRAVSGHQWPGEGRVEFTGDFPIEKMSVDDINTHLSTDLAADLAVSIVGDPFKERAMQIGSYEAIPCGGTHVSRLGEIATIIAKAIKAKSGRTRISFDASPNYGG
jgi:alanyl-tRNA synthetase